MRNTEPATTLRQLTRNCNPQMTINANHPFYVDVDAARNSKEVAPVRKRIKNTLVQCAEDNRELMEEDLSLSNLQYKKLLFVGHRASGKSTELMVLKDEITDYYEVIFIENVNAFQDRFRDEKEFIYFIGERIMDYCSSNPYLSIETQEKVEGIYNFLETEMFSNLKEVSEKAKTFNVSAGFGAEASAGGETSLLCKLSAMLLASLAANKTYNDEQKTIIERNKVTYFDQFLSYVNEMIDAINYALIKRNKTLLLIIDGLDKITDFSKTEKIFLGDNETLTSLHSSMIVTYPLYLRFSDKNTLATRRFDGQPFKLSQIKTHERDQSNHNEGIKAMWNILKKRLDVKALFENPDDLTTAIINSGGNIRDLFSYLVFAATNAASLGLDKIRTIDLELAYQDKQGVFNVMLTQEYALVMKKILEDETKEYVIQQENENNILLRLCDSEMIVEYNGTGWFDLHPMAKEVLERKIKAGVI